MIRFVQIALLLAIVIPFGDTDARADWTTAQLAGACQNLDKSLVLVGDGVRFQQDFETIYCWGYMGAVQDLAAFREAGSPVLMFCAPPASTTTQFIKIFLSWSNRNPQNLHLSAPISVLNSLIEAFPCKKVGQ